MDASHGSPYKEAPVKYKPDRPVLLDCPVCHSFISSKDIDVDKARATCGHCDHSFDFRDSLEKDPNRRPELIIPDGVEALKISSMLDLEIDWYKSGEKKKVLGLLGASFFWNILLIPLIILMLYMGDFFLLLIFSGHIFSGLYLIWYLMALLLNKTNILVDKEGIKIKHSPIPAVNRSINIPRSSIKQLYVTRYTQKLGNRKKSIQSYALYVILNNNKSIPLLKGMDQKTQLYLEQEIETYLDIKDHPVKGEVPRV